MVKELDRSVPLGLTDCLEKAASMDWRTSQLFENFHSWLKANGRVPYFLENDEYVKLLRIFLRI